MEPATRVAVTVTFLRMDRSPAEVAPGLPTSCQVVRAASCTVEFYRYLYDTVGADYVWWLRRTMPDDELAALLANPLISIHVMYSDGEPAGFFELDARIWPDINLSYFGLLPHVIGTGVGYPFLRQSVDLVWRQGARGMTVNTCTADHPRALPTYLRDEQNRIEKLAAQAGLDFFPTVFEILTYDQMNEIAAYGGFPNRYPHWRFGMEYERLAKSYEYGLSKIYEMVINNNPSYAYLLEGNSLVDQKLVMAHVYGHVDFFKNNFCFRSTDLDTWGTLVQPVHRKGGNYDPDRKWIDQMANHGARISRHIERWGINKVESFLDQCLSIENLIDPWAPFSGRAVVRTEAQQEEDQEPKPVPRLAAKAHVYLGLIALNSLDKHHGTFSGILCTGIVGGAVVPFAIGYLGDHIGLLGGLCVLYVPLIYILSMSVWARPLVTNKKIGDA